MITFGEETKAPKRCLDLKKWSSLFVVVQILILKHLRNQLYMMEGGQKIQTS